MIFKQSMIVIVLLSTLCNADPVKDAITKHDTVIVQFMRPSCPYSVYLNQLFKQIQNSAQKHGIHCLLIDITGKEQYKKEYRFSTVPTVIYFKKGKEVYRHSSNDKRFGISDFKKAIATHYDIKL